VTRKLLALLAAAALITSLATTAGAAKKRPPAKRAPLTYEISSVHAKTGGEPSIAIGKDGYEYVSWPGGGGMHFAYSKDRGTTWTQGAFADEGSGDTSVNMDSSGAVYQTNLNGGLQGDVYKSFDHGKTWPQKGLTAGGSDASASTFFVDREWADAYIPPGKRTNESRVYLTYHDWVPSQIWVNTSKDGGKTFSDPVNVISTEGNMDSFCDTIPGGLRVAPAGPHAGRVYVLWLAGDLVTNVATGCNITQLTTFHSVWIAYSDDEGATWTNKRIFDGAFTHDASALFADLTVDRLGNPYAAFGMNLEKEVDMYALASFDGAETWIGGTEPMKVNPTTGTHMFPAIVAGDPGKVAVAYIASPTVVPTMPYGKAQPAGDQSAIWDLWVSQTMNIRAANPKWTAVRLSPRPMHVGDVCVLGIFCTAFEPMGANRNLLDFIDAAYDPQGRVHISYTDDLDLNCICVANQTAGPDLIAGR
jgi:hypothetical protein